MRAKALLSWWQDYGNQGSICRPLIGFFAYRMGTQFYNFHRPNAVVSSLLLQVSGIRELTQKKWFDSGVSNFKQNPQVRPDLF